VEQEPWRLKVCFRSETSPKGNTKTQEATRYRGRIANSERTRNVLLAVLADHSTDGRKYRPGRWGSEPLATHCREGEAGYNVSLIGTMEDTQRSQPISTENQGIAMQEVCDSADQGNDGPPLLVRESSLAGIAMMAKENTDLVFTSLVHRIDLSMLKKSFKQLRKNESTGVDKITAKEYAVNLDENLYKLHKRLRRGQYVASPVKRIWVDKENGEKRPIGIPALEDKVVQKAGTTILGIVYEPLFHDFSHGFREGHSQHLAQKELREKCIELNTNWIISADITGLFDKAYINQSYQHGSSIYV